MKIINFLKTKIFLRVAKKYFEPDKKFLAEAKLMFLHKASAQEIKFAKSRISIFPLLPSLKIPAYALASIGLLFIMSTGAVALAEKQNVGPDNPLYGLKRLGEQAQVQLSSESKKTELHQKFAKRRLEEIKKIKIGQEKMIDKQQKTLKDLNDNFKENITAVAKAIEKDATEIQEPETTIEPAFAPSPEETFQPMATETIKIEDDTTKETIPEEKKETSKKEGGNKGKRAENLCQALLEMIKENEKMRDDSHGDFSEIKKKCRVITIDEKEDGGGKGNEGDGNDGSDKGNRGDKGSNQEKSNSKNND